MKPYAHTMLEPLNYELDPQQAAEVYSGDMLKIYSLLWNAAIAALVEGPVLRNHSISLELSSSIMTKYSVLIAQWTEHIEPGYYNFLPKKNLKQNQNEIFFNVTNEVLTSLLPEYNPETLQITQQIADIAHKIPLASPVEWNVSAKEFEEPAFGFAELIEIMANRKVGRPSTYASSIEAAIKNKLIAGDAMHLSLGSQGKHFLSLINQQPADLQLNSVFCAAFENDLALIEHEPNKAGEILNKYCQQLFQTATDLGSWLDDLAIEGTTLKEIAAREISHIILPKQEVQRHSPLLEHISEVNLKYATSYEELAWDDYIFKTNIGHINFKGRLYTRKADPKSVKKEIIFKEHLRDYLSLVYFNFLQKISYIEEAVQVEFQIMTDRTKGFFYLEALKIMYEPEFDFDEDFIREHILNEMQEFYTSYGLCVHAVFEVGGLTINCVNRLVDKDLTYDNL